MHHIVELRFTVADIDTNNLLPDSANCTYDSVSVFEGYRTKIGTFCGSTIPNIILSTGNLLTLNFHAVDDSLSDGIFEATYLFINRTNSK